MMTTKLINFNKQHHIIFFKFTLFLTLSSITMHNSDPDIVSTLSTVSLEGQLSFHENSNFARDFGNRFKFLPAAVMYPSSVSDIANLIKHVYELGPSSKLTITARGHGHSLQGQSQAPGGVVINMESLQRTGIKVHADELLPYVEASGGELWINVLVESLKYGLAPKSWTDYLHLTIGGTLSNAGVSGQAFRHGPQISNVYQLEIVTGKGEVFNCSAEETTDLFYGALGGLGQFGIITKAKIALEKAPQMVKWIRVLYSDFNSFMEDQVMLISEEMTFDYIEGFVIMNKTNLLNNWKLSFKPQDPIQASHFNSDGRTLFSLEITKNFNQDGYELMNQEVEKLLSKLRYMPSTLFQSEVTYLEFLDRVHVSEVKLREQGLWEVPHPWLNLLIPRTRIKDFTEEVFGKIFTDSNNGPILVYPVNRDKWDNRTSVVIPDEKVFYMVSLLTSTPSLTDEERLNHVLKQNDQILDYCSRAGIQMKQYLPFYRSQEEWKVHFGSKWDIFEHRKSIYDPLHILAPGQRIFSKAIQSSSQ